MSTATERRSTEAYKAVVTNGMVSRRSAEVYQTHYLNGPMGKREMYERYRQAFPESRIQVDSFGPRYAEMVRAGLMEEVGEKKCPYSGQTVTLWDVTPKVPTEKLVIRKGPSAKDREIARLREALRLSMGTISDLQRRLTEGAG